MTIRTAQCSQPIRREGRAGGHLLPGEESATLLLWAFPRLLGWRRTLNWLFSPVTGNTTYPGDLWGVDSAGNLLLVETKLAHGPQNPFEDFLDYPASRKVMLWDAASLEEKWRKHLTQEEEFRHTSAPRMSPDARLTRGPYRGVLPFSSHRDAVWRWQELYRRRIVPRLATGNYERAVERGLRLRGKAGNPPPIFVGVIATALDREPRLSEKGKRGASTLLRLVGPERTLLRGMRVAADGRRGIRVRSWTIQTPLLKP